jgi:hypothetical protein
MTIRAIPRYVSLAAAVWLLSVPAHAATLTVINVNDSGSGSLRAAVLAAGDGDTIQFDASIIPQTIHLTSGEIDIDHSITMTGGVTIDAGSLSRIFKIAAGKTVSLSSLTFSHGLAAGADGSGGSSGERGFGGAIWNQGTLNLLSCTFNQNHATGGNGGGISGAGTGGDALGGAIFNDSGASLDVSSCEFTQNTATGGAGGAGTTGGQGGEALGGAIGGAGPLMTISGSRFTSNSAQGGSAGASANPVQGSLAAGGAVWASMDHFAVDHATFVSNTATGGLSISSTSGRGEGGAFDVDADGSGSIDTSTFDGNNAHAFLDGPSAGGGIFVGGNLILQTSTLKNNVADSTTGTADGGGIGSSGELTMTNCTISGNQAISGGGASLDGSVTVEFVTIASNSASSEAGGLKIIELNGTKTIASSIIAQNTAPTSPDGVVVAGFFTSAGHNVIGVAFGGPFASGPGDQIGTSGSPLDPGLNPLANIGGPTATMGLKLTSPALDHGDDANCPSTDQTLATTRPQGAHCDAGAYELPATVGAGGNAFTLTVQIIGNGSVTSAPSAGIACPTGCSAAYFGGTSLTLTETPAVGAAFLGWSGVCTGVSPTAPVVVNANVSCTAAFTAPAPIPTLDGRALAGLAVLLGIAGGLVLRRM